MLLFLEGRIDRRVFEKFCENENLDPKTVIFLFPGNDGHHRLGTDLFTIKSGAGLAHASYEIGSAHYPTLSLPTTSMEEWKTTPWQQEIVQSALEDLYRTLGAGYHHILPVRAHKNSVYFDEGFAEDPQLEPNFFGGVQKSANQPLAQHYIKEINAFKRIAQLRTDEARKAAITNPAFLTAYEEGMQAKAMNKIPEVCKEKSSLKESASQPKATVKENNPKPKEFGLEELKPYYQYASLNSSRFHFFKALTKPKANEPVNALQGDALKTSILLNFGAKIKNCKTPDELDLAAKEIFASENYKILKQSQGFLTWLFGWKTSSLIALEQIIADQQSKVSLDISANTTK
ncbi:MAG: hypothetical protein EPN84_02165 [Legionella sp.]|nr:MAG: hypothetical protein EPN84_02165 [Legionella sp.]